MSKQANEVLDMTFCHHCGKEIAYCKTYPDERQSYWAHAVRVFNGQLHTLGNALMEQRCADGNHWATPARSFVKWTPQIFDEPAMANSHFGRGRQ